MVYDMCVCVCIWEREFPDSVRVPIKLAVIKAVYISIALGLWLIALQLKQI